MHTRSLLGADDGQVGKSRSVKSLLTPCRVLLSHIWQVCLSHQMGHSDVHASNAGKNISSDMDTTPALQGGHYN